jgi:UDP-N-acetylmuramate--alanine ligase
MLTRDEIHNIELEDLSRVHMIGIASSFSTFVAKYLISIGIEVTASKFNQDSKSAKQWIERGVLYKGGHDSKYITKNLDLVVFPNGPIPGNVECEKTEELDLPSATVGQVLGLISKNFKTIAVAGTHGKTTTSALITWMLYKDYRELPNFVIGDEILDIKKSHNFNKHSEYLVVEACEYKRQFLDRAPKPYISVITNVDLDHTDYYKDQEDYNSAFKEFVSNTQYAVVIDSRGDNISKIVEGMDIKVLDCKDIEEMYEGVTAGLYGDYNHENVLRACGVSNLLGIFPDIEDFPGVKSRFQYIGKNKNGNEIYLDYAHNPKKVKSCLKAARDRFKERKIVFIWQPHNFERCITFKEEFSRSLDDADVVLIPNIFTHIREEKKFSEELPEKDFVQFLQKKNPEKDIRYTNNFDNTVSALKEFDKDALFVFASAGDLKEIFKLMDIENE